MTKRKVLLVDDEPMVLIGYRRHLMKRFDVVTCEDPTDALVMLDDGGPFGVVVSDYRMPGMNGVELLSKVRESHPTVTRVMLTGQADHKATLSAIDQGNIFRFLSKPCSSDVLANTIADAMDLHDLVIAEKELIEGTLRGAVKALTELVGLASPEAQTRATRIGALLGQIGEYNQKPVPWTVELAARLSQIGCMTLDPNLASAGLSGQSLSLQDRALFESHAAASERLLRNIPRMEPVAALVGAQFAGAIADPELHRLGIPSADASAFFAAAAFADRSQLRGGAEAFAWLTERFDDSIVEALRTAVDLIAARRLVDFECKVGQLLTGMIANRDIVTGDGILLVSSGHEITEAMLERLRNFHRRSRIPEPLSMRATPGLAPQM